MQYLDSNDYQLIKSGELYKLLERDFEKFTGCLGSAIYSPGFR